MVSAFEMAFGEAAGAVAEAFGDAATYLGPDPGEDEEAVSVVLIVDEVVDGTESDEHGKKRINRVKGRIQKADGLTIALEGVVTWNSAAFVVDRVGDSPGYIPVELVIEEEIERSGRRTRR